MHRSVFLYIHLILRFLCNILNNVEKVVSKWERIRDNKWLPLNYSIYWMPINLFVNMQMGIYHIPSMQAELFSFTLCQQNKLYLWACLEDDSSGSSQKYIRLENLVWLPLISPWQAGTKVVCNTPNSAPKTLPNATNWVLCNAIKIRCLHVPVPSKFLVQLQLQINITYRYLKTAKEREETGHKW